MTALSDQAVERLRGAQRGLQFPDDRYTVTGEIGRGGMGTVYAAVDAALDREVAIKVSHAVAGAAIEQRLATESRVLARLEHPGIVPVHDVGRLADGRLFYVMKRVHGRTLTEHLHGNADLGERLRIFERICEAVAFAHASRIVHRDLKPDNVMIGAYGEVMVMDWGVAKLLDAGAMPASTDSRGEAGARPPSGTGHGTVLGTHGFMAPEQARGDLARLDERADVYSLGALLVALLSREPNAEGETMPRPLRSISARALATDPGGRYQSVGDLNADIARFRAGDAVLAHRENAFERASRLARLYRMPILIVVSYIVMRALIAWTTGW